MTKQAHFDHNLDKLNAELRAGSKLGKKLQQMLWKDFKHIGPSSLQFMIMYVLLLRAERTFYSIRTLARLHQVDDALALTRVMVEKVINAEYIVISGYDAAVDYIGFDAFRTWRDLEEMRASTPEIVPSYEPEMLKKLKIAHDRINVKTQADGSEKRRYARGHDWTDIGLAKRAEKVDEFLSSKFSYPFFKDSRVLYQSTYKNSSKYLHGMWASVARSIERENTVDIENEYGKIQVEFGVRVKDNNLALASEAVKIGNLTSISMLLFVGRMFNQDRYSLWLNQFGSTYVGNLK